MAEKILSGAKAIRLTPWTDDGLGTAYSLTSIIADSTTISQDDPETTEIGCETRDEPLKSVTTLGKYTVSMESADIQADVLVNCCGFTASGNMVYAPSSYVEKYVQVEIEMENDIFVLPRVLITSKFNAESLKTGVAKAVISGTAVSASVTLTGGSGAVTTPFFVVPTNSQWTVAELSD